MQEPFLDLNNLSKQFRNIFSMELPAIDDSGNLQVELFRANNPVVSSIMDDFVTAACTNLYCVSILDDWPNTEVLNGLSQLAIELILKAHREDKLEVTEISKSFELSNYKQVLIIF